MTAVTLSAAELVVVVAVEFALAALGGRVVDDDQEEIEDVHVDEESDRP